MRREKTSIKRYGRLYPFPKYALSLPVPLTSSVAMWLGYLLQIERQYFLIHVTLSLVANFSANETWTVTAYTTPKQKLQWAIMHSAFTLCSLSASLWQGCPISNDSCPEARGYKQCYQQMTHKGLAAWARKNFNCCKIVRSFRSSVPAAQLSLT